MVWPVPIFAPVNATKNDASDFPGGTTDRNPPASARSVGSIPGPGKSTYHRAIKPLYHNYWAHTLEPATHNYWSLESVLHNEKPPQWEARLP